MMLPVLPSYGLGATLNFIIQPATISIAHNVTLLTPPLGKWSFEGTKNALASDANHSSKEYTFERFLVPFSTCDERAILGRGSQRQQSTVQDGSNSETCGEKGEKATLCSGKDGWNKVVTGFDKHTAGYSDDVLRRGDLNLLKMAEMTFIDIFLMARGDGFLGKFSSNLDRIAVGLMLGTRNCIPPIVSLDSAWCNPWVGKLKTKKGVFTCALA
ncbi:unnamed protein product [Bathycoccus prasinos]